MPEAPLCNKVAWKVVRIPGGNGGVVKRGDKLPKEWRQNISKGVTGKANPMYGRTGAQSVRGRDVLDRSSGKIYPTVTMAAAASDMKMKTLYNMLSGHRPNTTELRFA